MKTFDLNTKKIAVNILTVAGLLLLLFLILSFTNESTEEKSEPAVAANQAMPVEVATPVFGNITEWDEYTGRFEASNRVDVRARVNGFLDRVNFTDGQHVKKGEVLFTLDDRPFKIALSQATAEYNQALASLKTAQDNYNRVESLRESGALSIEEYDRRKQALAFAQASVALSQSHVDKAKLDLQFTKVIAPISGLVSRHMVNEGNLIDGGTSNATLLTTIVATSPIYFYFTGSESDYLRYVRLARSGERGSMRTDTLPVFIKLQDEADFLHEAKIDFVDNEIDNSTGTIESRAILENKDQLLEPGMFGKARLMGSAEHDALMISDDVIGTNQSLRFVYVLGKDNTVEVKNITLGPLHTNGLRIIRDGLTKDDKLIVNNIQKIQSGMTIAPVESSFTEEASSEE
ncbi:efflux RND transporter periplasmic adaptor subunit [Leeuwenhoekiella marinoflava]|uniref:efflux RND transporter periplasmic adaptor subunit n=1 Tax=Leeuwenhoekiella marinoflava TaxID=988 RepID=UPI0030029BC3